MAGFFLSILNHPAENADHPWVELAAGATPNLHNGLLVGSRLLVGPDLPNCPICVDDRQNARAKRDRLALESVGIACAVPLLLVVPHELCHPAHPLHGIEDLLPEHRMSP